jgi:glutathione peroxidase
MRSIDGKEVDLSKRYAGKICLMVNVPYDSDTPDVFRELTALQKKYDAQGLALLVFPSDDFKQEKPGADAGRNASLKTTYSTGIDVYAPTSVKGEKQSPLYRLLTSREASGEFGGEIKSNFTKFLVGRDGEVLARFEAGVMLDAPEVIEAIESALNVEAEASGDDWEALTIGGVTARAEL